MKIRIEDCRCDDSETCTVSKPSDLHQAVERQSRLRGTYARVASEYIFEALETAPVGTVFAEPMTAGSAYGMGTRPNRCPQASVRAVRVE